MKPPIGIEPRKTHEHKRRMRLLEAICAYEAAYLDIPPEWLAEYTDLCNTGCKA